MNLLYLVKKFPVHTKRATNILIKVKSCNALLLVLLVCIHRFLKSVLRYKVWIHFGCLSPGHCLFAWGSVWESVVIFRIQKSSASKNVWEILVCGIINLSFEVVHEMTSVCLHVMRAGVRFCFRGLPLYFVEVYLLPRKCPSSWLRKCNAGYVFTKYESIDAVEHSFLLTGYARNLQPNSSMTYMFPFPFPLQIKRNF
jgi:hypothetical protein